MTTEDLPTPTDASAPDTADQIAHAAALRAGLAAYDLDETDADILLAADGHDAPSESAGPLPVLAVVGRPNVGKSTLVNRFLGRREAVVQDTPGVTRDRVSYTADWAGRKFTVVDTGGWERDARGLSKRIAEQAEVAVVPGEAFGPSGYIRMSYALGDDQLLEGVQRLQRLFA